MSKQNAFLLLTSFMEVVIFIGLLQFSFLIFKIASALYHFIRLYVVGSMPNFQHFGSWSVVTGATDGIGLAFARELAKTGQNIVLISRNSEKLEATASKIREDFKVEVKLVVADFSDLSIYDHIKEEIKDLDIGVLVNNVGVYYDYPEYFINLKDRTNFIDKLLAVNISSVAKMTDIVLNDMVSKKRGVILNIGSGSGLTPLPMIALYSASKHFVHCFSKSLNYECRKLGIIVQCLTPFYVATNMSKFRKTSFFVPSPEVYVKSALKTVGKTNCTCGFIPHVIQGTLVDHLNETIQMKFWIQHFTERATKTK